MARPTDSHVFIGEKRFRKTTDRKAKKKAVRREEAEKAYNRSLKRKQIFEQEVIKLSKLLGGEITHDSLIRHWLPTNLKYLLGAIESPFHYDTFVPQSKRKRRVSKTYKILHIPETFSLIDEPKGSFSFLHEVIDELLFGWAKSVDFSYENCVHLNIGAQVVLDIIIKEVLEFYRKCKANIVVKARFKIAKSVGMTAALKTRLDIRKILFSVGSLAIHADRTLTFPDIVPYQLCIHSREDGRYDSVKSIEQKDKDTTTLVDYVIDSLKRVNQMLSSDDRESLSKIIGEVLINAEEHATTNNRFSIGYFQERESEGKRSGIFRLVILNFGKTIYEKFADPGCPNPSIVTRMKDLSKKYTENKWYARKKFEEETLWTLYALQEGVTSIHDKKRGNGSIEFIDNFFSLKGDEHNKDDQSRLTILSGHSKITFDGTFRIIEREVNDERFKFMTFNKSGKIEEKPDERFVQFVDDYFPGTIISARIFFDEEHNDTN